MEHDFWRARWESQRIGFHQADINAALRRHVSHLGPGSRVLVPLCGKTLDMLFLREKGHPVVGVEFVEEAVQAFFVENALPHTVVTHDDLRCYRGDNLEVWAADFFALETSHLGPCEAVYDRAALIALPPDLRVRYAAHLTRLMSAGSSLLGITLSYPQEQIAGPPFAVWSDEVHHLFGPAWEVTTLGDRRSQNVPPRFADQGLQEVTETIWRMRRRSDQANVLLT